MRRLMLFICALFVANMTLASSGTDTLLNAWLNGLGGKEKVESIRTYSFELTVETGGLKGTAVESGDSRGNHRVDLNLADLFKNVTVFNAGERKAWMLDQNKKVQELEGKDLELEVSAASLASFSPLLGGRIKGTVTAAGPDALRIEPEGGRPFTLFFDPGTGLPVRMEQAEQERTRTTTFSDWRAVDGVQVAFQQRQTTGDPKYDVIITVQKVEWNRELRADAFQMPEEAAPDYTFDSGDRSIGIPFVLNSNHIFVPVSVNGSDPLWFALDTGADTTVIHQRRAKELGFRLEGSLEARGAGEGSAEISFIKDATFKVQGVEVRHQLAAAFDLTPIEGYEGHPFEGILGYDFISRFVVRIDYAGRRIDLFDPANYSYSGDGRSVPITIEGNTPMVRMTLRKKDGTAVEGKFDIDTGNRTCLVLGRTFYETHGLRPEQTLDALWGLGVGGHSRQKIGRIASLDLGGFQLDGALTSFSEDTKGAFADPELAGNIGGEILRRFTVILDYSRKVMILEPNKNFHDPFLFDMSGLNLTSTSPDFSEVRVNSVVPGSPAALAGIQEGDRIADLDGRAVTGRDLEWIRNLLKDGATHRIVYEREGKTNEVSLALKSLI